MRIAPSLAFMIGLPIGFAFAEEPESVPPKSRVVIDQVQLGDVWSNIEVVVEPRAQDAVATATSLGNSAAAGVTRGDIDADISQRLDGQVGAETTLSGETVDGAAIATTTAHGNSASGGSWDGNTAYRADQVASGDVSADAIVDLETAGVAAIATSTVANVSSYSGEGGEVKAFQAQASNASVDATSDIDLQRAGDVTAATTALGNSVTSTGSTATNLNGAVQTTAAGETIQAVTDVFAAEAGDVVAVTNAQGNSISVQNEFGFATLGREGSEVFQGNDSAVDAQSFVTVFEGDFAASSASGVGNSALISNVGSDTELFAIQNNFGQVSAQARFTGGAGDAVATSVALGNAATATLCDVCGDAAIGGAVSQLNGAKTTAQTVVSATATGQIVGSATAIGNTANVQKGGRD